MTATSTLEQIDWEAALDDSPVCEADDCEHAATHRIVIVKCGYGWNMCQPHLDRSLAILGYALARHGGVHCDACGSAHLGIVPSDICRVVPL